MHKKSLSERDICTKIVVPAIQQTGWDIQHQVREEVTFTKGRVVVRGNHLMRVRPTHGDDVEYLALYLNSPIGTAHMRRLAITASGLLNLSVGKIRSILVELAPKEEQSRIVAKVRELVTFCDQLKTSIAATRQKHTQLAEALVANAVTA